MGRRAYLRRRFGPCLALVVLALLLAAQANAAGSTLESRLAKALAVPHVDPAPDGGARGRPAHGRRRLRAERDPLARSGLEPEAPGRVRSPRPARPRLPLPHGGGRQRHPRRRRLARRSLAARLRRPDAEAVRPRRPGGRGRRVGDPARRRRCDRRRVLVRRAPDRARLAPELLHLRVAAAVGARRRPRLVPRPHLRQPRTRRRIAAAAVARGGGRPGRRPDPRRRADDLGPAAGTGCLRAARRRRPLHGP